MEEKDFMNKMENLKKPGINPEASRKQIKLALLNAKKSAAWGIWFLVIPVIFFACITIKEFLGWNWGIAANFLDLMADLDKSTRFPIFSILIFIVLPGIGAIVNLLAIMHFIYDKPTKELIVTIRLKWLNMILGAISIAVIGIILLYAISENSAERAIHRMEKEVQQPVN